MCALAAPLPLLLIGITAWQETSGTQGWEMSGALSPGGLPEGIGSETYTRPVSQEGLERGEPESTC